MANTRRQRSYRGQSKRTSGSGALLDTVKNTLTGLTGNRARSSGGGGLASKASGLVGGLLGGGAAGTRSRGRGRARGRRR